MWISLLIPVISRLLNLIKTICFNNIPVIIRLLKPGIRLNNIVYEILILLVKELLLSLKNLGINIIKVSFLNFVNKFLFKVLSSNKVSLTEQILEVSEILIIKKIINLKNINFILGGSIYCTINNINILEANLFIYITIIIYFVYFYNVILQHDSLNSTFLGRNWFKLILIGLILICILFLFVEIIYLINSLCDMLISKFFWTKYNNPIRNTGKQGESSSGSSWGHRGPSGSSGGPSGSSGGPGGPGGYDPSTAAAGSRTNQDSNSEGSNRANYDPIRYSTNYDAARDRTSYEPVRHTGGYYASGAIAGSSNSPNLNRNNMFSYDCTVDKIYQASRNHPLNSRAVGLDFNNLYISKKNKLMDEVKSLRSKTDTILNKCMDKSQDDIAKKLIEERIKAFSNIVNDNMILNSGYRAYRPELTSKEWNNIKEEYYTAVYQEYLWSEELRKKN